MLTKQTASNSDYTDKIEKPLRETTIDSQYNMNNQTDNNQRTGNYRI